MSSPVLRSLPSDIVIQDPAPSPPTPMHSPLHSAVENNNQSASEATHACVETSHDDSTTCIVCLVDLPETSSDNSVGDSVDTIARLLPCNHVMHNTCLAPWVERANSCPICRQTFNRVQLHATLSGPSMSAYSVEDRIQRPDIDLNYLEEEDSVDGDDYERCLMCDESRDSSPLIVCDCCKGSFHIFCCDLRTLPEGDWFCPFCISEYDQLHFTLPAGINQRQVRPRRGQRQPQPRSTRVWGGVWQDIWTHLNRDLEAEQEAEDPEDIRGVQLRNWDRRARIAQAQGAGASVFHNMTSRGVIGCASRPWEKISMDPPDSEEAEEAWKALDEFKAIETAQENAERKRRASESRARELDEDQQSQRKLKRPRTKPDSKLVLSTHAVSSPPPTIPIAIPSAIPSTPQPSVFGSWLSKFRSQGNSTDSVQVSLNSGAMSASPPRTGLQSPPFMAPSPPFSPSSPPWSRPHSPFTLTRRSAFSPSPSQSPGPPSPGLDRPHFRPTSPENTPSSSPTRNQLAMPIKEEIQSIVRSVLSPFYLASRIDTDQYTEINKGVSRHLYELVGARNFGVSPEFTENQEERQRLKSIAEAEVEVAIARISPKYYP